MHGRSQAVRLPKAFRLPGKEVRVTRVGKGVLLEPVGALEQLEELFRELDKYKDVPFMPEGRNQPPMPDGDISVDCDLQLRYQRLHRAAPRAGPLGANAMAGRGCGGS